MPFTVRSDRLYQDSRAIELIRSQYIGAALPDPTKILVMHFTYGATARSSAEWFRSRDNRGSSAHLIVDRDGSVSQCVPLNIVAWHAGPSRWRNLVGLNHYALSIEMANWGYLNRVSDGWTSYTGVRISDPVIAVHKNGNPDGTRTPTGWETYPEVQFLAAVAIAQALVAEYGVQEIIGHDDIAPDRKWDPGPAFDMRRFRTRVFGDRGHDGDSRITVLPSDGLHLRTGPGTHFESKLLLAKGTVVEPMESDGAWVSVSVIGASGEPTATGWVHSHYLGNA